MSELKDVEIPSIVHNIDCNIWMKTCRDKQFKLAIVDPPYYHGPEKRTHYSNRTSKTRYYDELQDWEIPDQTYFNELIRISEHQIVWGCNYFNWHFGSGRIVWDKVNGNNSFSDCEIASCSKHDSVRLFRYMWNGGMQGKSIAQGHIMKGDKRKNEIRIHQNQKPVNLYKWILSNYAEAGDSIVDTHVGSGSLRIACYDLGLPFYGTEISPMMTKKQDERFKLHISQTRLGF